MPNTEERVPGEFLRPMYGFPSVTERERKALDRTPSKKTHRYELWITAIVVLTLGVTLFHYFVLPKFI